MGAVLGTAIAVAVPGDVRFDAGLALLAAVLAALRGPVWARYTALLVAFIAAGSAWTTYRQDRPVPTLDTNGEAYALFEACVVEPPSLAADRVQAIVELAPHARARLTLYVPADQPPPMLQYGQRVEFPAKVRLPRNYQNPGAFDFAGYLARQDVYWQLSAAPADLKVLPGSCGNPLLAGIYRARTMFRDQIDRTFAEPSTRVMVAALLIGETGSLDRGLTDAFRKTSTYHAIVISGMHLSILAALVTVVVGRLPLAPWLRLMPVLLLAWSYTAMNGMSIPLARAAVALSLLLPLRVLCRRQRLLNSLAFAVLGYWVLDPRSLADPSFILSFCAVTALCAIAGPLLDGSLTPYLRGLGGLDETDRDVSVEPRVASLRLELRLIAEMIHLYARVPLSIVCRALSVVVTGTLTIIAAIATTTLIQFAMFVPTVSYFHQFPLTAPVANLIVTPLLSLAVPFGFAACLTNLPPLAALTGAFIHAAEASVAFFARFESFPRIPDLPWAASASMMASLALMIATLRIGRYRWAAAGLSAGCALVCLWYPWQPLVSPGMLELTALDVGQGESLLVAFPDRTLMLVDGGGIPVFGKMRKPKMDIGEDVVSPYLWSRRIRRVDIMVCTHQHDDHLEGLIALAENFRPREIWTGAIVSTPTWERLREVAQRRGIPIRSLTAGAQYRFGEAVVSTLSPAADYESAQRPVNNDSLVMEIAYGQRRFLLTGDAEKGIERALTERGLLHPVDVLKVGHHGSNTSTTEVLLEATQPKVAVMSLGRENLFHFPHPAVMARLQQAHAAVLRTDIGGAVTALTDGRRLTVSTYR